MYYICSFDQKYQDAWEMYNYMHNKLSVNNYSWGKLRQFWNLNK